MAPRMYPSPKFAPQISTLPQGEGRTCPKDFDAILRKLAVQPLARALRAYAASNHSANFRVISFGETSVRAAISAGAMRLFCR